MAALLNDKFKTSAPGHTNGRYKGDISRFTGALTHLWCVTWWADADRQSFLAQICRNEFQEVGANSRRLQMAQESRMIC